MNAACKGLRRDPQPRQQNAAGADHALLQPLETDAGKAEAPLQVRIHQWVLAAESDGIALKVAEQHCDRDHQKPAGEHGQHSRHHDP